MAIGAGSTAAAIGAVEAAAVGGSALATTVWTVLDLATTGGMFTVGAGILGLLAGIDAANNSHNCKK